MPVDVIFIKREASLCDGTHVVSNLAGMLRCQTKTGKCLSDKGMIIRNAEETRERCPYKRLGVSDAHIQGNHVFIEELQAATTFQGRQ